MKLLSLVNVLTVALSVATALCAKADDYKFYNTQSGSGYTKGDAVASALVKMPYGAKIEKVNVNGYSIHEFIKNVGYVQTYGSNNAIVYYSK